eukprot:gene19819-biopygen822
MAEKVDGSHKNPQNRHFDARLYTSMVGSTFRATGLLDGGPGGARGGVAVGSRRGLMTMGKYHSHQKTVEHRLGGQPEPEQSQRDAIFRVTRTRSSRSQRGQSINRAARAAATPEWARCSGCSGRSVDALLSSVATDNVNIALWPLSRWVTLGGRSAHPMLSKTRFYLLPPETQIMRGRRIRTDHPSRGSQEAS